MNPIDTISERVQFIATKCPFYVGVDMPLKKAILSPWLNFNRIKDGYSDSLSKTS